VLVLLPAVAQAQEQLPERQPTDQLQILPDARTDAVGACGSELTTVVDRGPQGVTAQDDMTKDPQTIQENLSTVRGTILHAEGNLLLVKLPDSPSLGTTLPANQPRGNSMAVVRLPAECAPGMLDQGEGVLAVGTPMPDGILNAESVQPVD